MKLCIPGEPLDLCLKDFGRTAHTLTLPEMNDFSVIINTDPRVKRLLEDKVLSVCGQVELIRLKQGTSGVSNCSSGKHLPR